MYGSPSPLLGEKGFVLVYSAISMVSSTLVRRERKRPESVIVNMALIVEGRTVIDQGRKAC